MLDEDKKEKIKALVESPSYKIAYIDNDFLRGNSLRGTRLLLEYNKAEMLLDAANIQNTIVIFGSARKKATDPIYQAAYETSYKISSICSTNTIICTGGGSGIMQAANHGAYSAGKKSIGLNIEIPHEQEPNPYITPKFCFNFHYFAVRKMHFLRRAKAMIVFPGGFGTLDELFETLTLIQTGKLAKMPVILFDKKWWQRMINFDALVQSETISKKDLQLFSYAQTPDEALAALKSKTHKSLGLS